MTKTKPKDDPRPLGRWTDYDRLADAIAASAVERDRVIRFLVLHDLSDQPDRECHYLCRADQSVEQLAPHGLMLPSGMAYHFTHQGLQIGLDDAREADAREAASVLCALLICRDRLHLSNASLATPRPLAFPLGPLTHLLDHNLSWAVVAMRDRNALPVIPFSGMEHTTDAHR